MASHESFKIFIRDQWTDSDEDGARFPVGRSNIVRFNPASVRGVMDMVLDGRSLMQQSSEDSILFLVRDLLLAAERLVMGDVAARVSFYETPYELVLQRIENHVFLTFYKGGQFPEVIVKDHAVFLLDFLDTVVECSADFVSRLTANDAALESEPLLQWMIEASSRLARHGDAGHVKAVPVQIVANKVESTRWMEPRNKEGFSFGFQLLSTRTDLLSPGRPIGNDLNALLFRGQFVVHFREKRRVMGEGFLFLQAEKMLAAVQHLLTAWEERRPMSIRLISEGLAIGVKLDSDDNLTLSFTNQAAGVDESMIVVRDLSPWGFADAVLGVCREIRRAVIGQAVRQRKNIRLERFSRDIRHVASLVKDQRREGVINTDIDRYKRQLDLSSGPIPAAGLDDSRGLMFKERWRLEAEGLELRSTLLGNRIVVITAGKHLLGVDNDSGVVLWRREIERSECCVQLAGRDGVVRVSQTGNVEMIELESGVLKWRTGLSPRTGGSPVLLVVDQGIVPAMIIVVEDDRHIVGLDMRTGEPRWRYSVARGGRFSLRQRGKLLYVSSDDTQLCAVDLEDGSLVWRFIARTRFSYPVVAHKGHVLSVGGNGRHSRGVLFCLDAYSGEKMWRKTLNGAPMTAPIETDNVVLIPVVKRNGAADLVAYDTATGEEIWRLPCDGWAETGSLGVSDGVFVINMAGGTLRAIHARTGKDAWTTQLGPTCSDDIPLGLSVLSRGGVLFAPADTVYVVHPETGDVIHCLGGEPPVPDLVHVNPDCSILVAEESGHIGMYEIARSFTVISGTT